MTIDHLEQLARDARAMVAATRVGRQDAPVPACPGWDLARLAGHLGRVHRFATVVARTGAAPDAGAVELPPTDPGAAVDYLETGVKPLLEALAALDPSAPCWNFTGGDQVGAFWPRRQAHEAAVHRFDAQTTAGVQLDSAPTEFALDGIDEYLTVMAPHRVAQRDGIDIGGSVHIHATDGSGEWMIRTGDGVLRVSASHSKGDVALRGAAWPLLLTIHNRLAPGEAGTEVFGDAEILRRWLRLAAG